MINEYIRVNLPKTLRECKEDAFYTEKRGSEIGLSHYDAVMPISDEQKKRGAELLIQRLGYTPELSCVTFKIDTLSGRITLCDYAQAGKNFDEDGTCITVRRDKV